MVKRASTVAETSWGTGVRSISTSSATDVARDMRDIRAAAGDSVSKGPSARDCPEPAISTSSADAL